MNFKPICGQPLNTVVCALFITCLSWAARAQTVDLRAPVAAAQAQTYSPANLSKLARRLDPNLDWAAYGEAYLRNELPQRVTSVSHDPALFQAEVEKTVAALKAEVKDSKDNTLTLDLEGETEAARLTSKPGKPTVAKVLINSNLMNGNYVLDTSTTRRSAYIAASYILLMANGELGREFELQGTPALESIARMEDDDRSVAYLRIVFETVRFNQNENVQVVLRKVQWFSDPERSQLMAENTETRAAGKLLKARYLNEGITFRAEPDHSLAVDGSYMLELLFQNGISQSCKELARERGHRVLECEVPGNDPKNVRVVHKYVGGRRAQVRFYSKPQPGYLEANFRDLLGGQYVQDQAFSAAKFRSGGSELQPSFANFVAGKGAYLTITALAYLELKNGAVKYAVVP